MTSNRQKLDVQLSERDIPDNPGPSIAGREPVIGALRRKNGLPVLRDEVPKMGEI